ncbi:MAG: hypothetical protein M1155_02405 [Patescibacteria group bacterium]|jgi:hypothetical protein|nr:hypothetical protein [Patescibacteria group bacterium]
MPKAEKKVLIPFFVALFGLALFSFYFLPKISLTNAQDIASTTVNTQSVASSTTKEFFNYAWNDQIGWISFNCENTNVCNTSNYKVSIDGNGQLSGYAWNDQIGWISFNTSDLTGCPSGTCNAQIDNFSTPFTTIKLLNGWAKILSDNSWIHLSGNTYKSMLHSDGSISGYAWSENFGWISFEGEKYSLMVKGLNNLFFPMTLTGVGFQQGATVSLIEKNASGGLIAEVNCLDQSGNNDFVVSDNGQTLTGLCPLYDMGYGNYDIKVTNPGGAQNLLSSASTTLFKITPPSTNDVTLTMPTTTIGNNGPISINKIESSNSLFGASVELMKDNQLIKCFTIHEYDLNNGWIPGKDEAGNVLPMQCDLTNAAAGTWNFVISKYDAYGTEQWKELTNSSISVNCIHTSWDKSYSDADAPKLYGDITLTDNCGTQKVIHGTCSPIWSPENSCIANFQQTATNCLNNPMRWSYSANIYGASCGSGYKCQSNVYVSDYGKCLIDPAQCNKSFACNGYECGSGTDLCGNSYGCGSCDSGYTCDDNSHKCKKSNWLY